MTSEAKPIRRRKLSDEIQDRLLEQIKANGMKPGEILPSERELMARFDVGRPAIREAMQNLQRMGILTIKHGGRPRLAEPSIDSMIGQLSDAMRHVLTHSKSSMDHLKEARVAFEAGMAGMAAKSRTEQDVATLEDILARQQAFGLEPVKFLEMDGEFHRAIAIATGNPLYESISIAMFGWLSDFHADLVRKPGLEELTLSEHSIILKAISKQDATAASTAMRDHLNRANALYHLKNSSK